MFIPEIVATVAILIPVLALMVGEAVDTYRTWKH